MLDYFAEETIKDVQERVMENAFPAVNMLNYLKGLLSLHFKLRSGATRALLQLCESACSKDKTSPPFSILHHAVRGGDADFVELIVKSAARGLVSLQDDKGETALHYAAKIGDTRIVRVLVEDGRSDMLAHSKRGALPIGLAIRAGHLSVAEYMLDYSHRNRQSFFDEKQPYSLMADAVGHPDILRALVHQCDIEIRVVPTKELIFKVATSGKTGAVDVLIEAGLDIETKRSEDASGPLHHAAKANNAEVVHALLRHGASVDAKDNAGQTPLHWAMKSGNLTSDKVSQIAKLLTESGSDVEAVDNNGDTPTRLARKGDPQPTDQLLAVLAGARADQSWCYRRAVILYKKQLEQESLRALMTELANMKEKELFNMVLGYL